MKIGFVGLPLYGHVNPMLALARILNQRGHEAIYFGPLDIGPAVRAAGVTFIPYGEKEYPVGSIPKLFAPLAKGRGLEVMQYLFANCSPGLTQAAFDYLPQKLKEADVELMIVDTSHTYAELAPMSVGIPYIHIRNLLPFDFSGTTPICLYSWPNDPTPEGRRRNLEGLAPFGDMLRHVVTVAIPYAEKVGLKIEWTNPIATRSTLAIIAQTPKEFDLPGIPWPDIFHYTGPFHTDQGRERIPFPWEKLTTQPLIYASLGTLVNGLDSIYKAILEAVAKLPEVQVVLSIGNNIDLKALGPIPSNTLVVRSAPQIELLKRAALCITHAGMNTALEALAQGVPMVAIPIAFDQPGIAVRIAYHGVGEFLDIENVTAKSLLQLISKVIENPAYLDKARHFQKVIAETNGLTLAASLVEKAFEKHQQELQPTKTGTTGTLAHH